MEKRKRPNILITEPKDYNPHAISLYETIGTVVFGSENYSTLLEQLSEAEIAVIRLGIQFDSTLLNNHTKNLRCIVSPTTGHNHIDTAAALKNKIKIISLQGETAFLESIPSTAEFTWGLVLALQRNIVAATNDVSSGKWNRGGFVGKNLRGKTLGIIGLGRVGKQVAHFANCFGMKVQAYDIAKNIVCPDYVSMLSSVIEVVIKSDVITIHIPSSNNDNFIDKMLIRQSKHGSIWINTSRSNVWDENAVSSAIISGQIAGIATDVLSHENSMDDILTNPLWLASKRSNRIIITPHLAGATEESMQTTEMFVAQKTYNWASE